VTAPRSPFTSSGPRVQAVGKVVRAGVGRRRVQTTVMILTVLVAVAASILAAGLLVASNAPFDHAFGQQHGAELTAQFDGSKVSPSQLAATAHVPGVTALAGPFVATTANPYTGPGSQFVPADIPLQPITIVGRSNPGGPVDDITLVHGHWATGPGQIVVDSNASLPPEVQQLRFPDAPGQPTLTVVGVARSVSRTANAWATPAQVAGLNSPDTAASYQMLYRFAHAGTNAEISAHRAALTAAVPAGALTGTQSYLAVKQLDDANTGAFVPFVAAFGILGLTLSVLIIGVVVSGAVGAATRRIGILKALGFTPGQVVRAYVAQALIPAAVGAALGVVAGNLLAIPVLNTAENAYGTATLTIPLWVSVAVPAVLLGAVAIAAMVPALRAGQLRAVDAIAIGRTPRAGRGRRAQRLAGWLPLPRPVSLGVARLFARPARSASLGAAVALGAVAVAFAVGLGVSLNRVETGRELDSAGAVVVGVGGPSKGGGVHVPVGNQPSVQADPTAVAAVIAAQPGTRSYYGTSLTQLHVSRITSTTTVIAYQGDSSWATHQMVSGHWLSGAGQAVVTGRFLTAAGVHVGDTVTISDSGRSTSVRIVGEVFSLSDDGMDLLTSTTTLADLGLDPRPEAFNVAVKSGTNLGRYLDALNAALQPIGGEARPNATSSSEVIAAMDALIALLTILLVVVAGLGVLNSVVLDTRERVHDLGVYKSLGMTPRQTITMVLTSVAGIGLLAGAIGAPVGVMVHHYVLPMMANVTGEHLPSVDIAVYHPLTLALLVFGGVLIAVAGALLPAGWAGATPAATALRTE
jgi:putative ABC transport system permease protein